MLPGSAEQGAVFENDAGDRYAVSSEAVYDRLRPVPGAGGGEKDLVPVRELGEGFGRCGGKVRGARATGHLDGARKGLEVQQRVVEVEYEGTAHL